MTASELVRAELQRLHKALDATMSDITPEQLHAVPGGHPHANTIAWNVFHCVRTEDNVVRFVLQNRRAPVWAEGGYAERLGLPATAQGTGMSPQDAQALRIKDVGLFREYMQKVWASTEEFFDKTEPGFFDTVVTIKPLGDMPVIRALGQVCVTHVAMHVGQTDLIRTLLGVKPAVGV